MKTFHATIRYRLIDNPLIQRILNLVPHADPKVDRYIMQQWFEGEDGQGEWRAARDSQRLSGVAVPSQQLTGSEAHLRGNQN